MIAVWVYLWGGKWNSNPQFTEPQSAVLPIELFPPNGRPPKIQTLTGRVGAGYAIITPRTYFLYKILYFFFTSAKCMCLPITPFAPRRKIGFEPIIKE